MIDILSAKFWDWVDRRQMIRRSVLGITLWMTWSSFTWAAAFASTCTKPGLEVAAILAAVLAPIATLQGFVFKVYADGKV